MGILSFFTSKGEEVVVRQTAKNAALGFKKLSHEGIIPTKWEGASEDEVNSAVLAVADLCQRTKPTAVEKKRKVIEGIEKAKRKTLVNYTCICVFCEYKGAEGRDPDDWVPWLSIINDELAIAGVPKELRFGWGLSTEDWVRINFFQLYRELGFYRKADDGP